MREQHESVQVKIKKRIQWPPAGEQQDCDRRLTRLKNQRVKRRGGTAAIVRFSLLSVINAHSTELVLAKASTSLQAIETFGPLGPLGPDFGRCGSRRSLAALGARAIALLLVGAVAIQTAVARTRVVALANAFLSAEAAFLGACLPSGPR